MLADEIEKLGKALFIASLLAEDIREHLAAKNPLQMIVEDGYLARQSTFEGKCAENSSEETVERAKREKRKFIDELAEMCETPCRCKPAPARLCRERARGFGRGSFHQSLEDRVQKFPGGLPSESERDNALRGHGTFQQLDISRRQPMGLS